MEKILLANGISLLLILSMAKIFQGKNYKRKEVYGYIESVFGFRVRQVSGVRPGKGVGCRNRFFFVFDEKPKRVLRWGKSAVERKR